MTTIKEYTLGKELGKGSWGRVVEASVTKTNKRVALKIVDSALYQKQKDFVRKEYSLGKEASDVCENAVEYVAMFEDKIPTDQPGGGRNTLFIVLAYLPGYTLKQYFKCAVDSKFSITVEEWLIFMIWMLETLGCVHKQGLVHGDLNGGNIYYDTNTEKLILIDFGAGCDVTRVPTVRSGKDSRVCTVSSVMTPPLFALPAMRAAKNESMYSVKTKLSEDNLRRLFIANDVYSILIIGMVLLRPDYVSSLKGERLKTWHARGNSAFVRECLDMYEESAGVKIPKIRKFYYNAFLASTKLSGDGFTGDTFLKQLKAV